MDYNCCNSKKGKRQKVKKTIKSFKNRGTVVCETIGRWVIYLYRNIRFHICDTYVVFQVGGHGGFTLQLKNGVYKG